MELAQNYYNQLIQTHHFCAQKPSYKLLGVPECYAGEENINFSCD
jgi:hypothetical protein